MKRRSRYCHLLAYFQVCCLTLIFGASGSLWAEEVSPPRAHTLNSSSQIGIGFMETLGGIEGLAISKGLTQYAYIEAIAGGSLIADSNQELKNALAGGIGIHYQWIQALDVACLSVGIRYQHIIGKLCKSDDSLCQSGSKPPTEFTEQIIDFPLRIMYFLSPVLSVHSEFGVTLQIGTGDPPYFGQAPRNGYQLDLFRGRLPFGKVGITLWI